MSDAKRVLCIVWARGWAGGRAGGRVGGRAGGPTGGPAGTVGLCHMGIYALKFYNNIIIACSFLGIDNVTL